MLPIAYTIPDACKASGLSRSTLYNLIAASQLRPRKHGARTLILESDLRAFLEGLPEQGTQRLPKRRASVTP